MFVSPMSWYQRTNIEPPRIARQELPRYYCLINAWRERGKFQRTDTTYSIPQGQAPIKVRSNVQSLPAGQNKKDLGKQRGTSMQRRV